MEAHLNVLLFQIQSTVCSYVDHSPWAGTVLGVGINTVGCCEDVTFVDQHSSTNVLPSAGPPN